MNLAPEIVIILRRTAQDTIARHQLLPDGGCSYCSMTWLHTETRYPCPPVRIANDFLRLTGSGG